MSAQTIVAAAMFFVYYHIGGLATTNILRLTAGNTLPVNSSVCVCDSCGAKITPFMQFPVISYLICRGKCRSCGASIPVYPLCLELAVMIGMSLITAAFRFSSAGVVLSFLYYEAVRWVTIALRGRRGTDFGRSCRTAILSMIPFLLGFLFFALLYRIV